MNTQLARLAALQLMETLGTDRHSINLPNRMEREYNPWSAPLAEHIEPEGTQAVITKGTNS
jgi:hypothetical protein